MRASELIQEIQKKMQESSHDPEVATYHHDDSSFYPPLVRLREGRIEIVCDISANRLTSDLKS